MSAVTVRKNIPFSRAAKILRGFTETNRMIPSELTESLLGAVQRIHEEAEVCEGAMLTRRGCSADHGLYHST